MLDEALQAMDTASAAQPKNHLVFYYYCQCALQSCEGSLIKSDQRGGVGETLLRHSRLLSPVLLTISC